MISPPILAGFVHENRLVEIVEIVEVVYCSFHRISLMISVSLKISMYCVSDNSRIATSTSIKERDAVIVFATNCCFY